MSYLLSQIWICLFLSALVAGVAGWLLARSGNKSLKQSLQVAKKDLVQLKNERDYYASELASGTDLVMVHSQSLDVDDADDMVNVSRDDLVKQLQSEKRVSIELKDKLEAQQQLFTQRVAELEAGSQLAETEVEDYKNQLSALQLQLGQAKKKLPRGDLLELVTDKNNTDGPNQTIDIADLASKPVLSTKLEVSGESHALDVQSAPSASVLKNLSKLGIKTTFNLLEKAYDSESIQALAKKLGEEPWSVRSWVSVADLLRIKGLSPTHAELLELAGVSRVQDLQRTNPKKLLESISVINRHVDKGGDLPDLVKVSQWVARAEKLGLAVSADIDQI